VPPLPLFSSRHQIINRYLHGSRYFCAGAELLAYVLPEKTSTTQNYLLITPGLFLCLLHYFAALFPETERLSTASTIDTNPQITEIYKSI
jgi:hypothetical protein